MNMKLGKVINYDGNYGEIEYKNEKYLFLNNDLEEKVSVGDVVYFRAEKIHEVNRAFFVKLSEKEYLDNYVKNRSLK